MFRWRRDPKCDVRVQRAECWWAASKSLASRGVKWLTPRCRGPRRFLIVRPSFGHVPNAGPGPRRVEGSSTKLAVASALATRPSPDTTEKPRPGIRPSRTLDTCAVPWAAAKALRLGRTSTTSAMNRAATSGPTPCSSVEVVPLAPAAPTVAPRSVSRLTGGSWWSNEREMKIGISPKRPYRVAYNN
jgi:hypothetical protein